MFKKIFSVALLIFASTSAQALLIDTNSTWDGNVNSGWYGSGQTFTVDAVENTFDDLTLYFDADSWGKTFDFSITDGNGGAGAVAFSTSFVAAASSTINIGQAFAAGSVISALIDYNGFSGQTAHFSYTDSYAGGNSLFNNGFWDNTFSGLDHRLIANFSASTSVPEPSSMLLFLLGFAGLLFARRNPK